MSGAVNQVLADQTFLAWGLARSRLVGLSQEEFAWEPVAGCWSLRRTEEVTGVVPAGRQWWLDGDGIEAPEPPPFTTVAWLVGHMTLAVWNYNDTIAGIPATPEPALPELAGPAVELWGEVIERFETMVKAFDDPQLADPVEVWGGTATRAFVISHVVGEVLHHAAEVGRLRDLYRIRSQWGS